MMMMKNCLFCCGVFFPLSFFFFHLSSLISHLKISPSFSQKLSGFLYHTHICALRNKIVFSFLTIVMIFYVFQELYVLWYLVSAPFCKITSTTFEKKKLFFWGRGSSLVHCHSTVARILFITLLKPVSILPVLQLTIYRW